MNKYFILICLYFSYFMPSMAQELVINQYSKLNTTTFINKIVVDKANNKWICTNEGLYKIGSLEAEPVLVTPRINALTTVADDRLGRFVTDGKTIVDINQKPIAIDPTLNIRDIEIHKGRLFVATDQGVVIVNTVTSHVEKWTDRNTKLKTNDINFIKEDQKGILWIGTAKGEVRIEGDKWKTYHEHLSVTDYYENKEGIWFIGVGEMWLVDYYNREYNVGLNDQLFSGRLNDFVIDSKGCLYVASDKLVRYDPYKETTKEYSEDAGLLSKKCTTIAADQNDDIWIGTDGSGLYRLEFGESKDKQLVATCILQKSITCGSGSDAIVKVTVSGGKGPYTYSWNDNKLKGDNPKGLSAGKYSVTVTDKIQNYHSAEITIGQPTPIEITLVGIDRITAAGKKNGSIKIKPSGGGGTYKMAWSNRQSNDTAENLSPGQYTVTVTDQVGCSKEATFEVPKEKFIPELDIAQLTIGKTLRINELFFKADSTFVIEESFAVLDEVLSFLVENPNVSVEIGGHTNTIPPDIYCDQLSNDRAKNVALYFYEKGITTDRLSYKGYGKRQPITTDESLQGRQKNQRVEIKILSL